MMSTTAALVLLGLLGTVISTDYCSVCRDHTMCKYQGTGARCGRILARGVQPAEKRAITDLHNQRRRHVAQGRELRGSPGPQPKAANMMHMTWNDELAEIAQRWSDQCTFAHDSCRKLGKYQVGQNIYMSGTTANITTPTWNDAVRSWYDEVKDFNSRDVTSFRSRSPSLPAVGHYTQVVWASSKEVGCGFSSYREGSWTKRLYVCNYGPAGNWLNTAIYKTGNPCSGCAGKCHHGLCMAT